MFENGMLSKTNIISNIEKNPEANYQGVVMTHYDGGRVIVSQCFIVNNSRLSQIPKGTIKYIQCHISGNTVTKGDVQFIGSFQLSEVKVVCFASKDIKAVYPYASNNKCSKTTYLKNTLLQLLELHAFFI